ncbi:MAG TPA: hypothetical protein PKM72_13475 [Nitrospirales bacterium]|nr:hypothetical protein [Nitrospirales bacterium]
MDRDAVSERENEKSKRPNAGMGIVGGVVGLKKKDNPRQSVICT